MRRWAAESIQFLNIGIHVNSVYVLVSDADEVELTAVELLDENEEQLDDDQKEEEEEVKEDEEDKDKETKEESSPTKKEGEEDKKEEKADPDAPEKTLLTHGEFHEIFICIKECSESSEFFSLYLI